MKNIVEKKFNIALTIGDPGGIGPELAAKSIHFLQKKKFPIKIYLLGDIYSFKRALSISGLKIRKSSNLEFINFNHKNISASTFPSKDGGRISYKAILKGYELYKKKIVSAIVTGPISKESLHLAGYKYDGHTGLLAHLCKVKDPTMMLANKKFLTLHVSTHLSLLEAIKKVKKNRIIEIIRIGNNHLKNLGKNNPSIGVCGLNPHAGEKGIFGKEEINEIIPAIKLAKKEGMNITGPISADVIFRDAVDGKYDLIIAQYHDQGHIPVKLLAFDSSINVSLGLPIIRTSVDHGTAFDIAWKNKARSKNMIISILYACRMINFK